MTKETEPYKPLGNQLKKLRNLRSASTDEVSGAVEIDVRLLIKFEAGLERPSEDILMLLINYFDIREDEAANMWKLAGYDVPSVNNDDDQDDDPKTFMKEAMQNGHTAVMMMAFDPRIIYSDGVDITANRQGVVLSFTQTNPSDNSRMPISRVGVSYDQAKALHEVLQKTLDQAKEMNSPKRLPPSASDSPKDEPPKK